MTENSGTGPTNKDSFAFVKLLAAELSAGKIDMPSFPDVAARVRQVLSDEFVSSKQVIRVVSSEPALAGKLLMIANSAALTNGCTAGVLRKTINTAMPSATPQAASKSKARRQSSPM